MGKSVGQLLRKSQNCVVMQNSFSTLKSILILYLPLMYVAIGLMLGVFSSGWPFKDWVRLIISSVGMYMLVRHYSLLSRNSVFRILAFFVVLILSSTFYLNFIVRPSTAESVRNMGDSVMWISVMVISYMIAYRNKDTLFNSRWIALSIPIYYMVFQSVRSFFILNTDDIALISTAYYALFLLPFALMIKQKWIMWVLIAIVFLTVVLSSKRAGFIALIGAIVLYVYLQTKLNRKSGVSKFKYFITCIIIGIVGYEIFTEFINSNDIHLLDRIANLQEDGGSGRNSIYQYTFNLLCSSDIIPLLFGHGFNGVINYSQLELSAHTDFLETPFDYGLLGMIVYLVFYRRLFRYYNTLKYYNKDYAVIFAVTLLITLILSLFAHLIIYPTHFLFFCMYWGFVMGDCDRLNAKKKCL